MDWRYGDIELFLMSEVADGEDTKEFRIQKCFSRSIVKIENGSTKTFIPSRPCS
jgi:hypothetical protein